MPVIRGETAGSQAYSYDVVWSVQSDYSLLQHEVTSCSNLTLLMLSPGCVLASALGQLSPSHGAHQAGARSHGHQVRY